MVLVNMARAWASALFSAGNVSECGRKDLSDMGKEKDTLYQLGERIYDLDAKVYEHLGSALGRVFNHDKRHCVEELVRDMRSKKKGHTVRSELALISNMARTIKDKDVRKEIMLEYDNILQEVLELPNSFASEDILDDQSGKGVCLKERFKENDHLIICIGRAYGCGGSEIGFALADAFHINYYDVEIFEAVLKRLETVEDSVPDHGGFSYDKILDENGAVKFEYSKQAFDLEKKLSLRDRFRYFNRYHGLPKKDAVFFNQSDLICDMAKQEDFVVMGRCADAILSNHHIPHISIFITAPMEQRIHRLKKIRPELDEQKIQKILKHLDKKHRKYYEFYTGRQWGSAFNYDFCVNSASYGIEESVAFIKKMIV